MKWKVNGFAANSSSLPARHDQHFQASATPFTPRYHFCLHGNGRAMEPGSGGDAVSCFPSILSFTFLTLVLQSLPLHMALSVCRVHPLQKLFLRSFALVSSQLGDDWKRNGKTRSHLEMLMHICHEMLSGSSIETYFNEARYTQSNAETSWSSF